MKKFARKWKGEQERKWPECQGSGKGDVYLRGLSGEQDGTFLYSGVGKEQWELPRDAEKPRGGGQWR